MRLRRIHPTDHDIEAALDDKEEMFGMVFQHCERCKPCRRRWMIALGLESFLR